MEVQVSFLAGTSIEAACAEAKDYAIRNNLAIVRFDFNGVTCGITQNADIEDACEKFKEELKTGDKYKFFCE
jgi:hypothetical protein